MRTQRHLYSTGSATLLACLTVLATGCAGDLGATGEGMGPKPTGTGGASGGPSGTGGAGTGTTGVDGGPTGGIPVDPQTCVQGVPETSQVARLKNSHYDNIVRDALGVTLLANGEPPSSLLNSDSTGAMNQYMWDAYQTAAATIASEVMAGELRANFMACNAADAGCLQTTITEFGRKAFRRPLTEPEVARFMKLGTTTPPGTPDEVAETTLMAFLVSPSFLQINEMSATKEGEFYTLTSHEVATRLALTLWGTLPDADLNTAADANMLTTKEQILVQAERMIGMREKAGHQIGEVHRHYLALDDDAGHWFKVRPDTTSYPLYKPEADVAMKAELDLFFEDVAYTGGSFKDIFLSSVAFVNQDTAPLYGVPDVTGTELTRVELDPTIRPGFLTRLGFLSSHIHSNSTSPILRGAFMIKNVIGSDQELIPDPDALMQPPPEGTFTTERDYVTELTNKDACKGCHHVYINPPGFVLESFDAAGAVQTQDPRGGEINATADVFFGSEPKTISSPLQLMQEIVGRDFSRRVYAERVVAGALSRLPNANDACLVDQLNASLGQDGYTILDLFADLTQADSFRLRNRSAL